MNLFEYEGKQLMSQFAIPVPEGRLLVSEEALPPMEYPFVLKAQVLTGGRGKAGGIQICENDEQFRMHSNSLLGMRIKGYPVHGVLAEELVSADRELYLSITLQGVSKPTLIASAMGGMDIEKTSRENPREIIKMEIDPFLGLKSYQKKYLAKRLQIQEVREFYDFLDKLERIFFGTGAKLVEINPLGVRDGKFIAMDSKIVLDDNAKAAGSALEKIEAGREKLYHYQPPRREETTITYVPLDGTVGLISDGAGTVMLTLDLMRDEGLEVASFCELGGMTSEEVMYRAMDLTLNGHSQVRGLLIVLIGGFNRMDNMALGITKYVREHQVSIPVYTRMCGTMEEIGLKTMEKAGMKTYRVLTEAVKDLAETVAEG
ncbi:MAG: ATP-grasp domain-containing protein [Blautia sp.]